MGQEGKIISIDKVTSPNKVVNHKIKFLAPRKGEYEFHLHVLSNAYIGFDHIETVQLKTHDASVLPEYKVHSDDESEEEGTRELSGAEKKKQELQTARKKAASAAGEDSDSDDDSDVEEVHADK